MTAWRQPFADRGRRFGRRRWRQWRTHGWQITQCAVAAAAAWWVASALLGHERPFFAPVVAVVALGVSYAARLRQVGEVVAGVALGVAVGDVFVRVAGTGTWQIALVIAVAMSLAVLLEVGPMLVTQAGVQASIVTTLVPPTSEGLNRWLDAVVGRRRRPGRGRGGAHLAAAPPAPADRRIARRPRGSAADRREQHQRPRRGPRRSRRSSAHGVPRGRWTSCPTPRRRASTCCRSRPSGADTEPGCGTSA